MLKTERSRVIPDLAGLRADGVAVLDEPAGKALLLRAGVEVPVGSVVDSPAAAAAAAEGVGLPCMVKLVALDLPHKSDIGGVAGPLGTAYEVKSAAARMMRGAPPSTEGLLVEPWIQGSAECFMGLSLSAQYGPVLMFGVGGIWVEEYQDVAYHLAPVDQEEATAMIRSRRAARVLTGARGRRPVAVNDLAGAMHRFSQLALDPDVREHVLEVEVNPLIVRSGGLPIAADCTVVLRGADGATKAKSADEADSRK